MCAAVFSDVEGTLVDASLPRLSLKVGREMGLFSRWQVAQLGVLSQLGKIAPGRFKQDLRLLSIKRAMVGQTDETVQRLNDAVLPQVMQHIKQGTLSRLRVQQENGHDLVLLSAGLHELIERIGLELGGRGEGTRYVRRDGRYLAELDGPACQGEAKAARALAICKEKGYNPSECFAYGDTALDIPFLAAFGHPHAVDPDHALAAEAQRRSWPIIKGGRP
jgi:phosphoserine phosphatase